MNARDQSTTARPEGEADTHSPSANAWISLDPDIRFNPTDEWPVTQSELYRQGVIGAPIMTSPTGLQGLFQLEAAAFKREFDQARRQTVRLRHVFINGTFGSPLWLMPIDDGAGRRVSSSRPKRVGP